MKLLPDLSISSGSEIFSDLCMNFQDLRCFKTVNMWTITEWIDFQSFVQSRYRIRLWDFPGLPQKKTLNWGGRCLLTISSESETNIFSSWLKNCTLIRISERSFRHGSKPLPDHHQPWFTQPHCLNVNWQAKKNNELWDDLDGKLIYHSTFRIIVKFEFSTVRRIFSRCSTSFLGRIIRLYTHMQAFSMLWTDRIDRSHVCRNQITTRKPV